MPPLCGWICTDTNSFGNSRTPEAQSPKASFTFPLTSNSSGTRMLPPNKKQSFVFYAKTARPPDREEPGEDRGRRLASVHPARLLRHFGARHRQGRGCFAGQSLQLLQDERAAL